jgi:hypothetical protein
MDMGESHDDREDHGGGAHDRGPDEHRLRRGLEGVPRPVVFLQQFLGGLEIQVEAVVPLDLLLHSGNLLDQRQLVDGLRVVCHRSVAIHRDGDRAHAQEPERDEAEGEDRRRLHQLAQAERAHAVGDRHQAHDGDAEPVG